MQRYAPDDLQVLGTLARLHSKSKNWDKVQKLAATLKSKHSDSALGYYYDGLVLQQAGQYVEAITAFEQALIKQPNAAEPLITLAKSQLIIGQPDLALQRVQQVIEAKPDHFVALNLKGEIFLAQKQYTAAEAVFNQVIELKPEWVIPYNNLLKIKLKDGDNGEATAILERGFENSQDPRLGLVLASRYEKAESYEKARQVYEKLLEKRPNFAAAANNLAMLLLRGEPDQSALDMALELVQGFELSENPFYLDTLALTYLKRGEPDKAVPVLERAVLIKDKAPVVTYHLGLAYHQLGRTADAVEKLKVATASEAQFEGIEEAQALLEELQ
jgi:tetratricopeptide (TPR) repeat protein